MLPKELRDMIWDEAIRDDVPSAHFFTMYDTKSKQHVQQDLRVRASAKEESTIYRVGLAAPYPGTDSTRQLHSWVDGNLSAYMADSGLWQACWESARRMQRRFQWHTEPVTMTFQRERGDNGESHYLTVRPSEDLLCLQFNNRSRISFRTEWHWNYLLDFPPFRRRLGGGWWDSRGRARHIAVELDPAWRIHSHEWPRSEDLVQGWRNAVDVCGLEHFWLVSYTMERRYRADEDRAGRQTFRAGGGLEFVEVLDGDDEWWDRSDGHDEFTTAGPRLSPARSVASDLESAMWEKMMRYPDWFDVGLDDGSDDSAGEEAWRPVGVLACVKHGSEKHLPTKSQWMDARRERVGSDGSPEACLANSQGANSKGEAESG